MSNTNEQAWAAAWASSLANGNLGISAAQTTSATPSKQEAQASGDIFSAITLLARLANQQNQFSADKGADAQAEPEVGQLLCQRISHSAFHPFNKQSSPQIFGQQQNTQQQAQQQQHIQQADADAEQMSHLEAVSFWMQLFQVAYSGLKSALQQAEANLPSLPTLLAALTEAHTEPRGRRVATGQQGTHLAQLRALLSTGAPSTVSASQQDLLSLQLLRQQPQNVAVALQQQSPQHHQSHYGDHSQDRAPQQPLQAVGVERSLDRFKPLGSFGPDRSLDRIQHQQNQQGFFAERSLDRGLPQHMAADRGKDRYSLPYHPGFNHERSLERGAVDPDSVVGFGKDWSLDPSDQSQDHLRKRARRGDDGRVCSNCGTTNTPFWRKDRHSGLALCNACGLYAAKNDHPRPVKLWGPGMPPLGMTTLNVQGMSRLGPGGGGDTPGGAALGSSPGSAPGSLPGLPQPAAPVAAAAATQQYVSAALQDAVATLRQSPLSPPADRTGAAQGLAQPAEGNFAVASQPPVAQEEQDGMGGKPGDAELPATAPLRITSAPAAQVPPPPGSATPKEGHPGAEAAPSAAVAASRHGSCIDMQRPVQAAEAQRAQQAARGCSPPAAPATSGEAGARPKAGEVGALSQAEQPAMPHQLAEGEQPPPSTAAQQGIAAAAVASATAMLPDGGVAQCGQRAKQEGSPPASAPHESHPHPLDEVELRDARALQSAAEALVAAFDAAAVAGRVQSQG